MLVGTDFGKPADEAIRQASDWAWRAGAELVVCHVMPSVQRANMLFPQAIRQVLDLPALRMQVEEALSERVTSLTGRPPDAFSLSLREGLAPHTALIEEARARNAGLLVVGPEEDEARLRQLLIGDVAVAVLRAAPLSVLVARPSPSRGRMLFATDFSATADEALVVAAREAKRREARLTLLHVLETGPLANPALAEAEMAHRLLALGERAGIKAEVQVKLGDPATAIAKVAAGLAAELTILGASGRSGPRRVGLGTVADRVARQAATSVLLVREG